MRQRYREGQEVQLGALGLVLNAIVFWDTLDTNAALKQPLHQGALVAGADTERLPPLGSATSPRTDAIASIWRRHHWGSSARSVIPRQDDEESATVA